MTMFRNGRTSATDEEHPLQRKPLNEPVSPILGNRRVTIDEVEHHLRISHASALGIIQDLLGFHKVCARWVPKELSGEHKRNSLTNCQELYYRNKGDAFLRRIVTGNELWIHHYAPESKFQSMEWKHPASTAKNKFKIRPSPGKVVLTLSLDAQGPILGHY
jgi:hypothetical protein